MLCTTQFYSGLNSFGLNHPVGLCELRGFVGLNGCRNIIPRVTNCGQLRSTKKVWTTTVGALKALNPTINEDPTFNPVETPMISNKKTDLLDPFFFLLGQPQKKFH